MDGWVYGLAEGRNERKQRKGEGRKERKGMERKEGKRNIKMYG